MKKSVVFATTAVSLGLATVLTIGAVNPSLAATHKSTSSTSATAKATKAKSGASFGLTQDARQTTSVNFTVTNVPSSITTAADAAKLLVVKVVPLASTATSAPATAPVPSFSGKGGSGDARAGQGPAFGVDNDGDGPQFGSADVRQAPSSSSTSGSTTSTTTGTAPTFGNGQAPAFGGDNDGDGPGANGAGKGPHGGPGGHGPHGGPGGIGGPGMQISNLKLANGVLTGTITLPGDETANVEKWGVYLSIAASSANSITAQSATPEMVTVTTASDLSASVTATTGDITLAIK